MSKQIHAKSLFIEGKTITEIATLLGVSRTSIYTYKNNDKANGTDWDELKFLKATDQSDAIKSEQDFVALLIHQFESSLDKLNNAEPVEQIEVISKHINTYYKLKQQRENPKVNKADIAKQVLQQISDIALKKEDMNVIQFLSDHADEVVMTVIS